MRDLELMDDALRIYNSLILEFIIACWQIKKRAVISTVEITALQQMKEAGTGALCLS